MVEASQRHAIAVVGMACRVPGAHDIDEFWQNLLTGKVSISQLDDDVMRAAGVPDEDLQDPNYVKAGSLIDGVDLLDAGLFGLSRREAEVLDPQHRVMLEVCHAALQHSGHEPSVFDGRIGIYAGARHNAYKDDHIEANAKARRAAGDLLTTVSNDTDYLATGVAYRLDLRGPAITSVTACSTSLVVAHQACRALLGDECDLALAGGVEIAFPVVRGYRYSEGSITSPDGQVRPFDANARGTVFGNGCGVVVLKRLSDALADNDTIHAVVLGSAVNNDGASKGAFASPSEAGQASVIEAALRSASVDPATIGYIEAHGTGTIVGDPLEIRALTKAYRKFTDRTGYCAISSVKANVGHLGAAAGICGLIKAVHCVREGMLPPAVNLEEPNPVIDFESSPFYPNTAAQQWPGPRRAAVSSYGIGGTNSHMILEEPPPRQPAAPPRRHHQLVALSARTETALDATANRLADRLRSTGGELADVAYTLSVGRPSLPVRRVAVAHDPAELADLLADGAGLPAATVPAGAERPVGFLFPGQGAQYVGMGRGLYESEPAFRATVDWCAGVLRDSHGLDLGGLLFSERADDELNQTAVTQPALFVVEYALAELLREWGVEPAVLAGHSVGEYVAAALSGVMEPEDALRLIADRGALMQGLPTGSMLAVMLPEEHLLQLLPPSLDVAAVNAPGVCTVSGEEAAVRGFQDSLAALGIGYRAVRTSHAFHSRMMDPILDAFRERVAAVPLRPPGIPFLSNVTGALITEGQAVDPDYWVRHLRSCVRFSDSLSTLVGPGHVLVEVGPGRTMSTLVAAHTKRGAGRDAPPGAIATLPPPDRPPVQPGDDVRTALLAVGAIWTSGGAVDWKRFWAPEGRARVPLPGYPYERERFWIDPDDSRTADSVPQDAGPYYLPAWRDGGSLAADAPSAATDGTNWVLFAQPGDGRLGDVLRRLRDAGARVVVAEPGADYTHSGEVYTLRAGEAEDYARMFREVAATGPGRLRLVHGWSVGQAPPALDDVQRCRHWLDHGFFSCLTSLQTAVQVLRGTPLELCIVTSDMQDVAGLGRLEPPKAAVLGLVTTAAREFEHLACHSVDVDTDTADELVGEQLFAELTSGPREGQVALRGWKRWTWSFTATKLRAPEGVPDLLKERGTYLITGGLGDLGLVLARQLAEQVRARLVLIGRSGLPGRAEWPALLERGPAGDATVRRIREVRAIEEAGAEVLVCAGDVADIARMTEIRSEVERVFGRIDGVFHLAGVAGDGMLETRSRQAAEAVLTPKVVGTYVVDNVFRPDLLVLYSSIVSVAGFFGLGDYCGANAVLDAFAQSRWQPGRHVVSINWPLWSEIGMGIAGDLSSVQEDLARSRAIAPAAHPLLAGRYESTGEGASFEIELSHDQWVLAGHALGGTPTMPGTGIVELIRAGYQEATGEPRAELRKLTLLRPLVAAPGVAARLELSAREGGGFDVRIVGGPPGEAPQEYARGQVHGPNGDRPGRHDLSAARRECTTELTVGVPLQGSASDALVTFGPRWDNVTAAHGGPDRDVATLSLPAEYAADTAEFYLHPALLDTAISLVQNHRLDGAYLPIGYDRLVAHAPMPARVHSILSYLDDGQGDLFRVDIAIVDDDGAELVRIDGYAMVRVDSTTGTVASVESQAPAPRSTRSVVWSDEGDGISPAEGAEMLRVVLGSRVRPQVICEPSGLAELLRSSAKVTRASVMERLNAASRPGGGSGTRTVATPYAEPAPGIERVIADLWQEGLGIDQVGADDEFVDLGGDSLLAVQLGDRLNRRFKVEVSIAELIDARTVRNLAAIVEESLMKRVAALSEEDAMRELNVLTSGKDSQPA